MLLAIASLFFVIWSSAIHTARVIAITSASQQSDPEEFWISVNLLNVEWKPDCLTISYCDKPELKMIKTNLINGEKSSFSWQLDQNFEQLSNSAFISHWTKGSPVDIDMNIEIIGIDPKYRFQRSCDQTEETKAFKYEEGHSGGSNAGNGNDLGQMIVELQGRCFNATLAVQKHIGHCPWCTKVEPTTISTTKPYENGFSVINQYGLVVMTCIVTSCMIIVCALQYILNTYEKSGKLVKRKAAILPVVQSRSWKIMKIDGNSKDKMSESSNSSRSTSKSDSLINITHDRIFANFDTAIKNHRLSSISNETYDKIAHSGDMPMRFMII